MIDNLPRWIAFFATGVIIGVVLAFLAGYLVKAI